MSEWATMVTNIGFPATLCLIFILDARRSRTQLENAKAGLDVRVEQLEKDYRGTIQSLERESREMLTNCINKNTDAMNGLNQTLKQRPCLIQEEKPFGR